MSKSTVTSREHHDAGKAASEKAIAREAAAARLAMDRADNAEKKGLADMAARYEAIGARVLAAMGAGATERGFVIIAEHGSVEAFKATGQAQPSRLRSYRRARVIAESCDAVGASAAEAMETYVSDLRDAVKSGRLSAAAAPTLGGFADYCAAGFELSLSPIVEETETETETETPAGLTKRAAKKAAAAIVETYNLTTVEDFDVLMDQLAELRLAVKKATEVAQVAA